MAEGKADGGKGGKPSLLERLESRVSQPGARGEKLREFIACEDEIREAVARGYSLREIWEVLTEDGRLSLAYGTFGTYVNRRVGRRGERLSSGKDLGAERGEDELDPEAAKRKRLVGV